MKEKRKSLHSHRLRKLILFFKTVFKDTVHPLPSVGPLIRKRLIINHCVHEPQPDGDDRVCARKQFSSWEEPPALEAGRALSGSSGQAWAWQGSTDPLQLGYQGHLAEPELYFSGSASLETYLRLSERHPPCSPARLLSAGCTGCRSVYRGLRC